MCNSDVNTCPHFGICGGCQLFDMSYDEQLKFKSEKVHALLAPYLGDATFEDPVASPDMFGYRNKMEFTFGDVIKDGPLTLGLHQKKSFYNVVTVDNCRIVDEDYRQILRGVLNYFSERGIKYYHKKRGTGHLRHLVIRKAAATGEILVMIVTVSSLSIEPDFTEMLLDLPLTGQIAGVLHAKNDLPADMVQAQELITLYGRDYFYENLLGLRFKITPFSFFQTNSRGAERLYEVVREYCGNIDGQKIFDLYSGTGTIAQVLAPAVSHVTGVEIVEEAVAAARENAAANGLTNCTFIVGDVFKVLSELPELPEFIVLDPPREGMTPKALGKILSYGVPRIVYVSCKPDSLARDLAIFTDQGYKVEKARCVDMFPWTRHVETCVLLVREFGNDDELVSIKVDLEGISLDQGTFSPAEKPTYGNIKKYIKEKFNLDVSSLYIGQMKDKAGIKERKSYNHGSGTGRVPKCPPEKEEAILDAFKHFNMI